MNRASIFNFKVPTVEFIYLWTVFYLPLELQNDSRESKQTQASHVASTISLAEFVIGHGNAKFLKPEKVASIQRESKPGTIGMLMVSHKDLKLLTSYAKSACEHYET